MTGSRRKSRSLLLSLWFPFLLRKAVGLHQPRRISCTPELQSAHQRDATLSLDLFSIRGGSSPEESDGDSVDEIQEDMDEDSESKPDKTIPMMSSQPVRVLVQTKLGNPVLDHRVELFAARTRNVASLKKSLSRQLPGRPPLLGLELVYEGQALEDEMLVDELFDEDDSDDEESDDEESNDLTKRLILNIVPPVDPKFASDLGPQLQEHEAGDDDTLSTEAMLEAYFLNQVALTRNAQLLGDPSATVSPFLRLEMQDQAQKLRSAFRSEVSDDAWEASMTPKRSNHHAEEWRGQRYRSGKGGARTNLKRTLQTNLNIHWGETIRNCLLFLFFGYFGGRNSLARTLMFWGAPLCFILQARPAKMWSKTLFYMMSNPPGIVLSLLPAPQQAILNADMETSFVALYGARGNDEVESQEGMEDSEDEYDDEP